MTNSMLSRPAAAKRTPSAHQSTSSLPLSRTSSRPGTPRSRARQMTPQPTTPTPRKGRKPRAGRGRSDQRHAPAADMTDGVTGDDEPSSEDEQALLELLGVTTPPAQASAPSSKQAEPLGEKGILKLSVEGVEAMKGSKRKTAGRERKPRAVFTAEDASGTDSAAPVRQPRHGRSRPAGDALDASGTDQAATSEAELPRRSRRIEQQKNAPSGLAQSRPRNSKAANGIKPVDHVPLASVSGGDPLDLSSLSKSLPTGGVFPLKPHNGAAVWDMPAGVNGTQELTWQQKLQAEDTPSKRTSKSTPTAKQRKANMPASASTPHPLHPGMHGRRASLDEVPVAARPLPASSSINLPISTFDSTIPYHTGYNVHRAPQTPAKGAIGYIPAGPLPVLGEFPRIGKTAPVPAFGTPNGRAAPVPGFKYAGPTFHNSPHADSLSKPGLDDF